ncbi:DUF3168 domain-containing protein [Enterovirga sp.]|jgi:hypothetical protein|uniref:DUF3168 domain-containing protein n=1 Tax=Enterovirga sp. TaxID=2026350 RepID=UPI002631F915|nr:DUF3168 domain-containing protein [Enterovirga sp.]MDB5592161.1 hypothetical protein [Enterovirga sp.]
MTLPLLPLRAAIRAACAADSVLPGLLGGEPGPFDEPPRGAPPLYAVFGDAVLHDRSSSGGVGHEQDMSIVLHARPGSAASALTAADRLAAILDDGAFALVGHHLVRLSVARLDLDRDPETRLARTTLRLVAVTESLAP